MSPRHLLHAALLMTANLAGLWLGFLAFYLADTTHQLAVQLPIAVAVSVAAFVGWVKLFHGRGSARIRFRGRADAAWVYGLAPVLAALVFVPLHLVSTGYVTAATNVLALWAFQLVANLAVVPAAVGFAGDRAGVDTPSSLP